MGGAFKGWRRAEMPGELAHPIPGHVTTPSPTITRRGFCPSRGDVCADAACLGVRRTSDRGHQNVPAICRGVDEFADLSECRSTTLGVCHGVCHGACQGRAEGHTSKWWF